jgi:hypothetical protein
MRTRRPPTWMLVAGTVAGAGTAWLLARPAAAGFLMMIFIMTGLPALYRLRPNHRAPGGSYWYAEQRTHGSAARRVGPARNDAASTRPAAPERASNARKGGTR